MSHKKPHYHRNHHAKLKDGSDHIADDLKTIELSSLISNGRSLTATEASAATESISAATPEDRRTLSTIKKTLKSHTP
jgi:hypothetical protein